MPEEKKSRAARDSRTLILAGAGRAFGRLGYGECRVEDIIEDAGVSRGTFYKFFDSKQAVFAEIEQAFELSFVQSVQGVNSETLTPWESAEAYIDAYLRWLAVWRDVARTLWTDPTRPNAETVKAARIDAFQAFVGLIAGLASDAGLQEDDPLLYRGVLGGVSEIGLTVIEMPKVTDADLLRARNAIIRIVVGSLTAPEEDLPKN